MAAPPRRPFRIFRKGDDLDIDHLDELPFIHVSLLGHGHSGTVEKVRDNNTGELFARKTITIPASRRVRSERSDTFHNEVRTIRKLSQHRHIIEVFATYITEEHFGLILRPVAEEGDLSKFLDRYWKLRQISAQSEADDRRLVHMSGILKQAFGCLASGLVFMHTSGIRHKDIKPHNILIHKGAVVYTDFGYSLDTSMFSKSCVYLELLSALRDEPALCPEGSDLSAQKDRIFAASMDEIHTCLADLHLPEGLEFLSSIIVLMTGAHWKHRPTSEVVVQHFADRTDFSCAQCCTRVPPRLRGEDQWQWSEPFKDYYIASCDESEIPTASSKLLQAPYAKFRSRDGPDARTFWVLGRVFRMKKWRVNVQTQARDDTSSLQTSSEKVQSAVQCFVVVKVNQTYVQTCLITTYKKKGTLGLDCDPSKHTIVFSSGIDSQTCYLDGERERGLVKHPIEVALIERTTKLPRQSRISLVSTVAVNFGDQVKDIGMVIPEHRELLRQYWSEEREDFDDEV
ncbi:kinase-like domain-containing protein [Boeremia exigua]|uniref:kinase-like domain-containing protein n=1 Tax=Boeremia exigua TaxID=749465 RepID=UPI001E8ED661|nr:kinase-like domain-containing protein [Boeremia exigua]KAH6644148.1 kinase-like domain-containing protein [Boeremia exigua]